MSPRRLPPRPRQLHVLGVDDGPFRRRRGARVPLIVTACAGARLEGVLSTHTRKDGWGATDALLELLGGSRFLAQAHLVLLDGLAVGGLNLIDLPRLASGLDRPCLAVMRRLPRLAAMRAAIRKLPRAPRRLALLEAAGPIHQVGGFVFQVAGLGPDRAADALARSTPRGKVPEPLRLAHIIGAGMGLGESKGRA